MRELIEAVILGIVQGLTEFLPVSSSGHLEIMKFILGDQSTSEQSLLMTVVLHFATACATLYIFRNEVKEIVSGLFKSKRNEAHDFSVKIILSMIPAALIGIFMEDFIESMFNQQLILVGVALLITALLLIVADRAKETNREVSFMSAIWIGIAQAIAIIPGISRSGATISTAVLLKIDRDRAARFSFLMVVPLIFGKMAKDLLNDGLHFSDNIAAIGLGFMAAFLTGCLACLWMIKLVKKAQLKYFGWYCTVVGLIAIFLGFTQS